MITYSSLNRQPSTEQKSSGHVLLFSLTILLLAGLLAGGWYWTHKGNGTGKAASAAGTFNKQRLSVDTASSSWIVVNKKRPLNPQDYAPNDLVVPQVTLRLSSQSPEMHLRREAADALGQLFRAAQASSLKLSLSSGYRPYAEQLALFNQYVAQQGQAAAEKESAHPGHSEHQTGLAADVAPADGRCVVQQCFATTAEGQWLAKNAYVYGFTIRYSQGKESITGYEYEPWHIRYVGLGLAAELQKSGKTMEEYFGLPAAPNY